jgi:hypothetical protein
MLCTMIVNTIINYIFNKDNTPYFSIYVAILSLCVGIISLSFLIDSKKQAIKKDRLRKKLDDFIWKGQVILNKVNDTNQPINYDECKLSYDKWHNDILNELLPLYNEENHKWFCSPILNILVVKSEEIVLRVELQGQIDRLKEWR